MSFLSLLDLLGTDERTRLLGSRVTELLRFTFTENGGVLDRAILNKALARMKGRALVKNRTFRSDVIESLPPREIEKLGFDTYEAAVEHYLRNLECFVNDFDIEQEYWESPPVDHRKISEVIHVKHGETSKMRGYPHPYQLRLKHQLFRYFSNSYHQKVMAVMPTGAGKTVLAMELLVDWLRSSATEDVGGHSILWIVHSKELCEQSLQSFHEFWRQRGDRPIRVNRFFDRFNTLLSHEEDNVTFASFHLLAARITTPEVQALLSKATFLVVDEVHASNARTFHQVLFKFNELNAVGRLLGLTATPHRSDDSEFSRFSDQFNEHLEITTPDGGTLQSPMEYLIQKGYLAQLRIEEIGVSRAGVRESDYFQELHRGVIEHLRELCNQGENCLVFAESLPHAVALSLSIEESGLECGLIVGDTPPLARKRLLSRFGDKQDSLNIIVNESILSTGIDVPKIKAIMVLRPIGSATLALQMLGRAMRGPENGGNDENIVFLTSDNIQQLADYKVLENIVRN